MNNLWNLIPSLLTLVAGGGWLFDRRRHRQEVESLRADNRQKDMHPEGGKNGAIPAKKRVKKESAGHCKRASKC